MKPFADLIAHGLALLISIMALALVVEVKQDVNASPLKLQSQIQAYNDLSHGRKEWKSNRKERRIARLTRRKIGAPPRPK
jgi:hypothetical protein